MAYGLTRHSALDAAEAARYTGSDMPESLLCDCNGEAAVQAATQALVRQGFHVVRSFDLHSALDAKGPPCDAEQSIGLFVVLLVYGHRVTSVGQAPVVVTIHGRGDQAEAQIVPDVNNPPDEHLVAHVWRALREAALSV